MLSVVGQFFWATGHANVSASVPRSYMRDEGRSLEAGLQEQASNHLKLLW